MKLSSVLFIVSSLISVFHLFMAGMGLISIMSGFPASEMMPKVILFLIAPICSIISYRQLKREEYTTSTTLSIIIFILTIIMFIIAA